MDNGKSFIAKADEKDPQKDSSPSAEDFSVFLGELTAGKRELLELLLKDAGIDFEQAIAVLNTLDTSETLSTPIYGSILPQERLHVERPDSIAKEFSTNGDCYLMPVSFAQHRLWFLDQFDRGSPMYNLPAAVRLVGDLNLSTLKNSIQQIIRRHEILRTIFTVIDGQPYQLILPDLTIEIPVIDFRGLPEELRESAATEVAKTDARQPFELFTGPLFRVKVLQLAEQEFIVLINTHHIIADGWSVGVIIFEISVLYQESTLAAILPELPVQYSDFAVWQRNYLSGRVMEEQLDYWRAKLAGCEPFLLLATDRPRPAVQSSMGLSYQFALPDDLYQRLLVYSQREGVTLFMTLFAVFSVLLYRYSGQEDLNVGVPVANRTRAEIENLVGFFVNTLVFRCLLSGEPSFNHYLGQIKETTLEAFAHQDLPFEVMVEKLELERSMSHSPLFQVMFALQNAVKHTRGIPGLALTSIPMESGTAKFDFSLIMTEESSNAADASAYPTNGHLSGAVEFNADLFDLETIGRMIDSYRVLLENILDNQEVPISHLKVLNPGEFKKIAIRWNNTDALFEDGRCIHELVADRARLQPNAPAVIFRRENRDHVQILTYHELEQLTKILASYLKSSGVCANVLVGIMADRSMDMIVAMLGVLEAGGAYLPLDPHYPTERLAFMIKDSGINILILAGLGDSAVQRLSDLHGQTSHLHTIDIKREWPDIVNQYSESIPPTTWMPASPESLAYVIYTSGSTGKPKGVAVRHRGICNLVKWQRETFEIDRRSRILQFSPFSFDASVWEIFMALANGAVLCLTTQEVLADGIELVRLINEQSITTVTLPPSVLSVLPLEEFDSLPTLKTVIAAGEHCTRDIANRWAVGRKFFNAYGPTEATVCASAGLFSTEMTTSCFDPPIGKPIANTQIYVFDKNSELTPVGVAGELCIGGVGLASGYVNRPELTATNFILNPLANYLKYQGYFERSLVNIYRSGDLVRWRSDGNLEFLGRVDQQVKVRGYRIEPAEIEILLRQYTRLESPEKRVIQDAAVVAQAVVTLNSKNDVAQSQPKHKRLVAFAVLVEDDVEVRVQDLRQYLEQFLPEYMIPSIFVILPALPLTPSGKVDRKYLEVYPVSVGEAINKDGNFIPPRTPQEEVIADQFSQLLSVDRVGVYDSFFDLGGHSLLATQLVSRLRELFLIDLPLRTLFETPTVSGLAEIINIQLLDTDQRQLQSRKPEITPIDRDPHTGLPKIYPPLSFSQQRLWFLEQFDPGTPRYNIASNIRFRGYLDLDVLRLSFKQIAQRHEILRTAIVAIDGEPRQFIRSTDDISLIFQIPIEDISALPAVEREKIAFQLAKFDAMQPFDISTLPLIRVRLLRLADDDQILLVNMHHIISDGWSVNLLIKELGELYRVNIAHEKLLSTPIPKDVLQYADYAVWQRKWLQGEIFDNQLNYWKERLSGLPPVSSLPGDYPRPTLQTVNGSQLNFSLDANLKQRLTELGRVKGATLYMVLLAALDILICRESGQSDICIGTPIANRTTTKTENLIGFFVNTLALRSDLSDAVSFSDVLEIVKETTLGAYSHQDIPFELLVSELHAHRDTSYTPFFQIMFVLQNIAFSPLEMPGLQISSMDIPTSIARFDITLTMTENGGLGRRDKGLSGIWEYNTDLYQRETIVRLSQKFQDLLDHVAEDPDTRFLTLNNQHSSQLYGSDGVKPYSPIEQYLPESDRLPIDKREKDQEKRGFTPPRTPEEAILTEIWSKVLGIKEISVFDNFFELGGDSILSIRVTALANQAGLRINARQLFENQTIAELALIAEKGTAITAEQNVVVGDVPLPPIVQWFLDLNLVNPNHFNQSLLFQVHKPLDPVLLKISLDLLIQHHDSLRLRLRGGEGDSPSRLTLAEWDGISPFEYIDLAGEQILEEQQNLIEAKAQAIQESLDIKNGPLLRMVYFNMNPAQQEGEQIGRLLVVIHHLATDALSWRIFLEDFQSVYWQLSNKHEADISSAAIHLPPKTTSYRYWSESLFKFPVQDINYWKKMLEKPYNEIRPDNPAGTNDYLSIKTITRGLDEYFTHFLLQEAPAVYKTEIQEMLLAAIMIAYRDWRVTRSALKQTEALDPELERLEQGNNETTLLVAVEGYGREMLFEDVDISRTMGWFTNIFPIHLTLSNNDGALSALKRTKEYYRTIQMGGIGFGLNYYLQSEGREVLKNLHKPDICLNYLGQVDRRLSSIGTLTDTGEFPSYSASFQNVAAETFFSIAPESPGLPFDPSDHRPYLIEISCNIMNNKLFIDWTYSQNQFFDSTIDQLANLFVYAIKALVQELLSEAEKSYTPSDFRLAGIDQTKLDHVLSKLDLAQNKEILDRQKPTDPREGKI